jgi:hypothetical protein
MKTLLLLLLPIFLAKPSTPLLLLDTTLRKPAQPAMDFSSVQYLQHQFPVYAADVQALVQAADKVVKEMEGEPTCHRIDTVATAHSTFLLVKDCTPLQSISVMLLTKIEETGTTYGYNLVVREENRRKAQQKVLDFATYIAR